MAEVVVLMEEMVLVAVVVVAVGVEEVVAVVLMAVVLAIINLPRRRTERCVSILHSGRLCDVSDTGCEGSSSGPESLKTSAWKAANPTRVFFPLLPSKDEARIAGCLG